MSLCANCVKGYLYEGTPTGKWEKIGGVDCYVATPDPHKHLWPHKVVLYLPDVFGAQLINSQLLADNFASQGFKTIVVDYFGGDPIPADGLDPGSTFDTGAWFARHPAETARPYLDSVISALKKQGIKELGGTGYCYGGRMVFDLAFANAIQVAVASHPSLLQNPTDLNRYLNESKAPLLINSAEFDTSFTPEFQTKADELLGGGKFPPGYLRTFWPGCSHGFAVRGDLSDPLVKAGQEGAFKAAVDWFRAYPKATTKL
ncbi:chlorocatechol-degradation protein [Pluteus cervinus]|uniref:Chlorocatechol-degradation protein n=1 Tax=Pluteus cervinus TaxID=181527 RepID=A0ACD3ATK5_9AGAR|nr:chlorocatechol-degradation protein [Pluteus cervinus]